MGIVAHTTAKKLRHTHPLLVAVTSGAPLITRLWLSDQNGGSRVKQYPKKTAAAVRGHVFLTLLTFTLANAFRTAAGQALAASGIRRQRAEQTTAKVIIFADEFYALFDIEEVLILLGVVPQHCLSTDPARVRRTYGLPDTA